jgi:hypothetical protein
MEETVEQRRIRRWRDKAEECRTIAAQMRSPQAREQGMRLAASYDRLADSWERNAALASALLRKPSAG